MKRGVFEWMFVCKLRSVLKRCEESLCGRDIAKASRNQFEMMKQVHIASYCPLIWTFFLQRRNASQEATKRWHRLSTVWLNSLGVWVFGFVCNVEQYPGHIRTYRLSALYNMIIHIIDNHLNKLRSSSQTGNSGGILKSMKNCQRIFQIVNRNKTMVNSSPEVVHHIILGLAPVTGSVALGCMWMTIMFCLAKLNEWRMARWWDLPEKSLATTCTSWNFRLAASCSWESCWPRLNSVLATHCNTFRSWIVTCRRSGHVPMSIFLFYSHNLHLIPCCTGTEWLDMVGRSCELMPESTDSEQQMRSNKFK